MQGPGIFDAGGFEILFFFGSCFSDEWVFSVHCLEVFNFRGGFSMLGGFPMF